MNISDLRAADFWGKLQPRGAPTTWHPFEDHCLDVACAGEAILALPTWRDRLERLGLPCSTPESRDLLAFLLGLHDLGKLSHGFQRGREPGVKAAGHTEPALVLFVRQRELPAAFGRMGRALTSALPLDARAVGLLQGAICHHGRPQQAEDVGRALQVWDAHGGRDPVDGLTSLLDQLHRAFPRFAEGIEALPRELDSTAVHAMCGLAILADWVGSHTEWFPYRTDRAEDRLRVARDGARRALVETGMDTSRAAAARPRPAFADVTGGWSARGAQATIEALPIPDEPSITVLEASTGSGKTEAALLWFARLLGAGRVEGVYDAQGNLLESKNGAGETLLTATYNSWGAIETWTDADGHLGRVVLDSKDQVLGFDVDGREIRFTLDGMGRVVGVDDPEGDHGTAVLDARGEMVEFRDPLGHVERWVYDDRGFVVSHTDKAARVSQYAWDDDGRLISQTLRSGGALTYDYDLAGRLAEIVGPDTFVRYTYDALDRVVEVEGPDQTVTFEYDLDDRIVRETQSGVVNAELQFTYTPEGRPVRMDSDHGSVEQGYDSRGRPVSLEDSRTGTVTWTWGADDLVSRQERAGGLTTEVTYSDGKRVERLLTRDGPTVVQDLTLTRDAEGRIVSKVDAVGQHTYTYDDRGRLLTAEHAPGTGLADEHYTYDGNGNRLSWAFNPPSEVQTDAMDRLGQDATYAYRYDPDGRLIEREHRVSGAITWYVWDSLDRLARVEDPDAGVTSFKYDGLGRRIELSHDGSVRRYMNEGLEARAALDAAGVLRSWTTLAGAELVAEWADGTVRESVVDHLGTRVGWYASGVLDTVARDTFGRAAPEIGASGTELSALTWHAKDPTGLVYMGARYYDPEVGRFLSEDPVDATNVYTYALNNPVSAWDPFGMAAAEDATLRKKTGTGVVAAERRLGVGVACRFTQIGAIGLGVLEVMEAYENHELLQVVSLAAAACEVILSRKPPCMGGKGGGRGNSFESDTEVETARGSIAISEIESSDLVVSSLDDGGRWFVAGVTHTPVMGVAGG